MNYQTVVTWICLILFLLALLYESKKENQTTYAARQLAYDAAFLAIILIMGFIPQMGYIAVLPGLSLTLMHLPVLLGASLFGWKRGLLYGLFFGFTSWMQALSSPIGFNAFFVVPWVAVLPRAIFGFLSGLFFQLIKKNPRMIRNVLVVGSVSFALTIIHTLLVFASLFAFYFDAILPFFQSQEIMSSVLSLTFGGIIAVGALGEGVIAGILIPLLNKASMRLMGKAR